MNRVLARLVVVAAALVVTGSAAAAVSGLRVIGRESASGDHAIATASGHAKRPAALYVRITSRPRQKVSGNWTVVCSRAFDTDSKSGSFRGRSPIQRRMRLPMARPDDCTAAASGSLNRSGRIVVTLLKR